MIHSFEKYKSETQLPNQAYSRIRKAIGYSGIFIPLICLMGTTFLSCELHFLPSISHYYYSYIGDLFVGAMSAMGIFLVLYQSSFLNKTLNRWETHLTNLAGLLAFIVANVPTKAQVDSIPEIESCYYIMVQNEADSILSRLQWMHLPAAGMMIIIFGIISYNYFPRNSDTGAVDSENKSFYRNAGLIIFSCIGILAIYFAVESFCKEASWYQFLERNNIVLWLECVSVSSFAFSWLKKGRALNAFKEMVEDMKKST